VGYKMRTKANIERLAKVVGATVEEDYGTRNMRTFQVVAPPGKLWHDGGTQCLRLEWARGATRLAREYNEVAYLDAESRIRCGLYDMTAEEAEFYATE